MLKWYSFGSFRFSWLEGAAAITILSFNWLLKFSLYEHTNIKHQETTRINKEKNKKKNVLLFV